MFGFNAISGLSCEVGAVMHGVLLCGQQHVVFLTTAAFGARSVGSDEKMLSVLLLSAGLAK